MSELNQDSRDETAFSMQVDNGGISTGVPAGNAAAQRTAHEALVALQDEKITHHEYNRIVDPEDPTTLEVLLAEGREDLATSGAGAPAAEGAPESAADPQPESPFSEE